MINLSFLRTSSMRLTKSSIAHAVHQARPNHPHRWTAKVVKAWWSNQLGNGSASMQKSSILVINKLQSPLDWHVTHLNQVEQSNNRRIEQWINQMNEWQCSWNLFSSLSPYSHIPSCNKRWPIMLLEAFITRLLYCTRHVSSNGQPTRQLTCT